MQAPELSPAQRQALTEIVERGPDPDRDGVARWRLTDPAVWISAIFGMCLCEFGGGRRRPAFASCRPDPGIMLVPIVLRPFEPPLPIETLLIQPAGRPPGHLAQRLVSLLHAERDALRLQRMGRAS